MVKRLALTCALGGALLLHARAVSAHGAEMFLGSTASKSGALALDFDFSDRVVVTPDVSLGGMTLYTNILPGFEWLQDDQASPLLYSLKVGTPFNLRIASLDPGVSVMVGGTTLSAPGQSAFVATTTNVRGDHFHPQWQLLLPDGVTGNYSMSFELTTTAHVYTTSQAYTLVITNLADATDTPTATIGSTPSPTASDTEAPTAMPPATVTPAATAPSGATGTHTATATPISTATTVACPGDCNGNAAVTVNELVTAVTIALGTQTAELCPAADVDRSGHVTIDELVRAVTNALDGCSAR